MRRTIYLTDDLAASVDAYLKLHEDETFSSLVQAVLEEKVAPRDSRGILRLAGLVNVDAFESDDKAVTFDGHLEDQFIDRAR